MSSMKNLIYGVLFLMVVGLLGAIPFGIIGLLFSGSAIIARDVFVIVAVTLSAWLPLKLLIDSQVKGQQNFRIPNFNPLALIIGLFGSIVFIPVLYSLTFAAVLIGILAYVLMGNLLAVGILTALIAEAGNIYRGSLREKELGVDNNIFMRVQNMSANGFDVTINPERMQRSEPRDDSPEIVYLPEDNLRDRATSSESDEPMTITLDTDDTSQSAADD